MKRAAQWKPRLLIAVHILSVAGLSASGAAPGEVPAESAASPAPDGSFDCGTMHPAEALEVFQRDIAAGRVRDPATIPMPRLPVHTGTPLRGAPPTVTQSDIFPYEDSADLLITDFSSGQLFELMADASRALLEREGDRFDFIAFFLNFNAHHTIGAAFYLGLENDTTGLGLDSFNNRPGFGIPGENLEGWVMMWNQASWSATSSFTRLVLGQEFEHRWGMFLNPLSPTRPLQGLDDSCGRSSHWNFKVDAQGSGMEVREWQGSSPATRVGGTLSFNWDIDRFNAVWSYPDLYLMGYVSPAEMDAGAAELRYMNDGCGSTYNGVISTWSSADVIATSGVRVPNSTQSQKDFRCGWIMIHRPGTPPNATQLNNVVNILNQWTNDWNYSSLGRGTLDNTLFRDCNSNTITDSADIAAGTSNDCNEDVVPDECELAAGSAQDCNANGQLDSCDIDLAVSSDCQPNGIPDECDIGSGNSIDCTGNSTPDECETDCNSNGVRDDCDIASAASGDCDANAVPDECDIAGYNLIFDCNSNGAPDPCDIALSGDCDANGVPDVCTTEACEAIWSGFEPVPPFAAGSVMHNIDYNGDGSRWDNPTSSATIGNQGCPASTGKAMKVVSQTPPTTDYVRSEFFRTVGGVLDDGAPVQSVSFDVRSEAQLNPRIDWQLSLKDGTNDASVMLIHWASTQSNYPGLPAGQRGKILVQDPANPPGFLVLNPTFTITANTCYSLQVVLDNFANTVQLYINGTLRLTTTRLNPSAQRMDYFRLEQKANGQASGGLNRFAIDNVQLCYTGASLTPGGLTDCNANSVRDDCDIAGGTSADANANGTPDECEGTPAAEVVSAVARKACDLPVGLPPAVSSESRQGGVTELRIAFNVPPGGPGPNPVTIEQRQCPPPGTYAPYSGAAVMSSSVAGNELVLQFAPGLENLRTYRLNIGAAVTSVPNQFVEIRSLLADANSDGQVNATDRSLVVGAWTGGGFSCPTDINSDGQTNATDRSLVVGAWTGGSDCAP